MRRPNGQQKKIILDAPTTSPSYSPENVHHFVTTTYRQNPISSSLVLVASSSRLLPKSQITVVSNNNAFSRCLMRKQSRQQGNLSLLIQLKSQIIIPNLFLHNNGELRCQKRFSKNSTIYYGNFPSTSTFYYLARF